MRHPLPNSTRQLAIHQSVSDTDRTTSVYDGANRLLWSDSLSGITTYSYDPAGNRTRIESPAFELTTYTWNAENQLVQIEQPGDEIVTHVWSPVNKDAEERIVQHDDGLVTHYLWDNNNILQEISDSGEVTADYTYQPEPYGDLVSYSSYQDDSFFYGFDALGSTTRLTDQSGTATAEYRYTAFGQPVETTGSHTNPYRWVGKVGYRHEAAISLYNLRARDYDPVTNRFLSVDPLGLASGDANFYRYVANQPTNLVDPSGLEDSGLCKSKAAIENELMETCNNGFPPAYHPSSKNLDNLLAKHKEFQENFQNHANTFEKARIVCRRENTLLQIIITTLDGVELTINLATAILPLYSDVRDLYEFVTAKDLVTGEALTTIERLSIAVLVLIPVVSGALVRRFGPAAYDMLQTIRNDLIKLRDWLLNQLSKLCKELKERALKTVDKLNEAIERLYELLYGPRPIPVFGGGPANPLDPTCPMPGGRCDVRSTGRPSGGGKGKGGKTTANPTVPINDADILKGIKSIRWGKYCSRGCELVAKKNPSCDWRNNI